MSLVAHLGCYLVFSCQLGQGACFIHGVCEWFLAVNMLVELDGHGGSDGVCMIWRGNRYRIDAVAFLLQHDPEILVAVCLGELFEGLTGANLVYITEGNDIFPCTPGDVDRAFTASADGSDVQTVIGSKGRLVDKGGDGQCGGGSHGFLAELTACDGWLQGHGVLLDVEGVALIIYQDGSGVNQGRLMICYNGGSIWLEA